MLSLQLTPATIVRPLPPTELRERAYADPLERFAPDGDAWEWIRASFLEEGSALYNPEHAHLRFAHVGILWTNVGNHRQMRTVLGTAEMPAMTAKGGKWARARTEMQLRDWFGDVPDFLITLDAPFAVEADDASFCALVEHELFHCAQKRDPYGAPMFSRRTGRPLFALRGHDSEEFVGVVARYGLGAVDSGTRALVAAGNQAPSILPASIASVCGTMARAA